MLEPWGLAVLFQGNRDALKGFTRVEAELPVTLLNRLIVNLDRLAAEGPR